MLARYFPEKDPELYDVFEVYLTGNILQRDLDRIPASEQSKALFIVPLTVRSVS